MLKPKPVCDCVRSRETIKVKSGHRVGPGTRKLSLFPCSHITERPCEDIVKRQSCANQEESSHQKPAMPAP